MAPMSSASAAPRMPRGPGAAMMLALAAPTAANPKEIRAIASRRPDRLRALMPVPLSDRNRTFSGPTYGPLVVVPDQPSVQLGAQFLGHRIGIDGVADDLRPDEDDQLSAGDRLVLVRKKIPDGG